MTKLKPVVMAGKQYGPIFTGGEDPVEWLADYELYMLSLRILADDAKAQALSLVIRGKAKAWYDGLEAEIRMNWNPFKASFLHRFRKEVSPATADAKLRNLKQDVMGDFDHFLTQFEEWWAELTTATQLANGEYFKLDKFLGCLYPKVREKVDLEGPENYNDAVAIARIKSRKMRKRREQDTKGNEGVMSGSIPNQKTETQIEAQQTGGVQVVPDPWMQTMQALTNQVKELRLSMMDKGPPRGNGRGRARPLQGRCYNCGEEGHYAPECPEPPRERGGIYPLYGRGRGQGQPMGPGEIQTEHPVLPAPLPANEEVRRVNVIRLEKKDVEVMASKRTRQAVRTETEEEARKRKGKARMDLERDEAKTSKKRRQRRIKQTDYRLGMNQPEYDLIKDVSNQRANITFGQLLSYSPKLRRQWTSSASTRLKAQAREAIRAVHNLALRIGNPRDVVPLLDAQVEGKLPTQAYVDGGAQVCVMTEWAMEKTGVKLVPKSSVKMRLANYSEAKCLGITQDVRIRIMGIECLIDFFVIKAGDNAYPIILGRQWLLTIGAKQDWEKRVITIPDKVNKRNLVIDMVTRESYFHPREGEEESEPASEEYETDTRDGESETETEEEGSEDDLLKVEPDLFGISVDTNDPHKVVQVQVSGLDVADVYGMLGDDLTGQEKEGYVQLCATYPRLFATEYTELCGARGVKHRIQLKEGCKPKVQRLRRLGEIQKEALWQEVNKLLDAGFIYPVKESEWVSPVVITPKKNGKWRVCVDYKPLNAATQRNHYPLPFQDEILNQVAGHERYSVMDGFSGYFQIGITEEDQLKTTFITPWGCFAYRRMPFGLMNAYATFQEWMNKVFEPYLGKFIRVFMDDIGCYSSRAEHLSKLSLCFQRLNEEGGQLNPKKCRFAQPRINLLGHVVSQNGIEADPEKVKALVMMEPPTTLQGLASFVHKLKYLSRFFWMLSQYVFPLHKLCRQTHGFQWDEEAQVAFDKIKEILCQLPVVSPPNREDSFYVSLAVGTVAIGAVLLQKVNQNYRPVYFESRATGQGEQAYTEAEQWVMALIFACRKFKIHLIGSKFFVITTNNLLPEVVLHLKPGKRIMKWILELQEYEFEFKIDHTSRSTLAEVLVNKGEDLPTYPRIAKEETSNEPNLRDAFTLWFDGAYRRVLSKGSGGVVIQDPFGKIVFTHAYDLEDVHTNNEAEYLTLQLGMKQCIIFGITRLVVKGDALLVIKQLLDQWQVKKDSLKHWFYAIKRMAKSFEAIQFKHVRREDNQMADQLASSRLQTYVAGLVIPQALYKGREVLKDVDDFLNTGQGQEGLTKIQRRRLVQKASKYTFVGDDLMIYGRDGVLQKVLYKEEIGMVLQQCHEESGHMGKDQVLFRVLRAGFWWPSIVRDTYYWCRTCHKCQTMGERRLVGERQGMIVAYEAFEKWGLDAIGPLPRSTGGKKYIIVGIDYLTKWIEAKAIKEVNAHVVADFVYEYICCRFGVPQVLISDRGQGFRSQLMVSLVGKMGIQHQFSSPYHPQCNGLVESINGQVIKMLSKYVYTQVEEWEANLAKCLWAYRTSYKVSTNFTPFELVYGQEVVLPIHMQLGVFKSMRQLDKSQEQVLCDRITSLERMRDDREAALDFYVSQREKRIKKMNQRLPGKSIKEGDLVMRYESYLDFTFQNKFKKKWAGPYRVYKGFPNGTYQLEKMNGEKIRHRVNGVRLKLYFDRSLVPNVNLLVQRGGGQHG